MKKELWSLLKFNATQLDHVALDLFQEIFCNCENV